jgi:aldehyde dehydrogenase (NAD+)
VTVAAAPRVAVGPALEEINRIYEAQQRRSPVVRSSSAPVRIEKIRRFKDAIMKRRDDLRAALWADVRKPAPEVDLTELFPVVSEARHAIRHLRGWMRPHRVSTPLALFGSSSSIIYEPRGVVLVVSPWNFPFNLSMGPVISAIAAGNCVILKPSEMTPHTSAFMKRLVSEVFDESEVAVIEGEIEVGQALLRKRWDHIFFTGSPGVGKKVMAAAAEHLTSVTLELGGKSPVIVHESADLDVAAQKIAWGKQVNSGQVCIGPDYVLVDEKVKDRFLEKLRAAFPPLGDTRALLVNDKHAERVRKLFDEAVQKGARVVVGGEFQENPRVVPPTVLSDVSPDTAVMREEIFGPLLPVVSYSSFDEALRRISSAEKPLVLYMFSRDERAVQEMLSRTSAGGTVINDTLVHFYQVNLPFGGVGNSGVGKGHGFFGFQAFSNARGVLRQWRFSAMPMFYPPFTAFKQKLIDFIVKYL